MLNKLYIFFIFVINLNAKFMGDVGYGYNFYRYEEPGLMRIEGFLHTIFAKLAYIGEHIVVNIDYVQAIDKDTKYNGSTMSGIPLLNIPSKDNFYDIAFKFGERIGIFNNNGLGYVGIGYRYLNNKISGSGGYQREQVYYYIPIGYYASDSVFTDGLFARYGVEFRYLFLGVNKTHIGDAIFGANPSILKMIQKNSFGLKVYSGFEYFLFNSLKTFIQVSVDYWNVRESSIAATRYRYNGVLHEGLFIEPKNNTIQFGIEAGIGF